ncbi:hypothetical protein [Hydrogenophaga sp. 2FB]|uniref:hypothetical protein n=1 Tax=Hydrogenophaga sp. 2FB TaxID=2502187 RepID=UPI0010F43702|nr:hypothetical protein [Hydrogenophaga sp. 2FB]
MNLSITNDIAHLPDGQRISLAQIRAACASIPAAAAAFSQLTGAMAAGASSTQVAAAPRVLITVSGGVADYIADQGVEVRIYDRDNALEGAVDPVPATWADLARPSEIPVEGDDVDADVDGNGDDLVADPVVDVPRARSPRMR